MSSQVPEEFLCPISGNIMRNPVTLKCGHTFDKSSVEEWRQRSDTCPNCRELITDSFTVNYTLKSLIDKSSGGHSASRPNSAQLEIFRNNVNDEEISKESLKEIRATFGRHGDYVDLCLEMPEMKKRRPVSFVCIIDVSGSMGSTVGAGEGGRAFTRLDLVKHVLNVLITTLTEADSLSLITFSNETEVILDLVPMSKRNKILAKNCVNTFEPQANTYTGPALRKAYDIMRTAPTTNVRSIVLLTDGQDTAGEEMLQKIFDQIEKPSQVQLNTFGFSNDIWSKSLQTLAIKGGGIFGFIPDQSMIGTIFVNFLANTFMTFAQDVYVEPNHNYELNHHDNAKTNLQYDRKRHFLLRQVHENHGAVFTFRIGYSKSDMIEMKAMPKDDEQEYVVQKAKYKLLDMVMSPDLPHVDVHSFTESKELKNVEDFLHEIKQAKKPDPNFEQIKLSLQYWGSWGAHYVRSFVFAHIFEQCINFKSPSMKAYQTKKFNELVDKLTDLFITIPPPKPSGVSYDGSNLPKVTMGGIMDRNNGCILSTCRVQLKNGEWKQIGDLKKGDTLVNNSSVVCVIRSKYDGLLIRIDNLFITPYHPILVDDKWTFPIDYYYKCQSMPNHVQVIDCQTSSVWVCNLVLDQGHIVPAEDVNCVTLGHEFSQDVVRHDYYGTHKVIEDLQKLHGWNMGSITLTDFKVRRDEKMNVSGIYDHQYLTSTA